MMDEPRVRARTSVRATYQTQPFFSFVIEHELEINGSQQKLIESHPVAQFAFLNGVQIRDQYGNLDIQALQRAVSAGNLNHIQELHDALQRMPSRFYQLK